MEDGMPSPLPDSSPGPFDLQPGTRRGTALLLHGFTGSPYEVLPLAVALREVGWRCVGPVLPGHGTSPADLGRTTAAQIMEGARTALERVGAEDGRVAVAGLSMGGALALWLAGAFPDRVTAVVALAPALRFYPPGEVGIRLSRLGLGRVFPLIPKFVPGGDCGDPEGRRLNPSYAAVPLGGLAGLGDVRDAAWEAVPHVRAPTLVIHGGDDRTVPCRATREVVQRLREVAPVVEERILPRSRHLLALDVDRDELVGLVQAFLDRVAPLRQAGDAQRGA
jgi:carboxylesterase